MLAPWLLYSIGMSALFAVAAAAAESLVAAWRWPRRGVWLVAIVLAIATPAFAAFRTPALGKERTV